MRFVDLEGREHDADQIRMSAFICNDPAIIGYSVRHSRRCLSIHAHVAGEDTSIFYQLKPRINEVWQYMPVDKGEVVVEIWKYYYPLHRSTALLVRLRPHVRVYC
jgi:hypothetical protein